MFASLWKRAAKYIRHSSAYLQDAILLVYILFIVILTPLADCLRHSKYVVQTRYSWSVLICIFIFLVRRPHGMQSYNIHRSTC